MNEAPPRQPLWPFLLDVRVQRIDGPAPELFAFTLFAHGQKRVLVLSFARPLGAGLSTERPKGEAASAFVRKLRKHGENARLIAIEGFVGEGSRVRALELVLLRGAERTHLLCDFDPERAGLYLLDEARRVIVSSRAKARRSVEPYEPAPGKGIALALSEAELEERGTTLVQAGSTERLEQARKMLCTSLERARKKVQKRIAAIEQDLARSEQIPALRAMGNAILCAPEPLEPGASSARLPDAEDPTRLLEFALDPRKNAYENANAMFERARRLERGQGIGRERLVQSLRERERLTAALEEAQQASAAELEVLTREWQGGGASAPARPQRRKGPKMHVPYRIYDGPHGLIYVGKSAADNDALTLGVARPHDHFVHVRGAGGSHVIVPRERNQELAPELLLDAAHLAAHFSAQRGESTVEIQHIERRYVRKAKGSAPGAVILDRERVLLLRVEPARLKALQACERQ